MGAVASHETTLLSVCMYAVDCKDSPRLTFHTTSCTARVCDKALIMNFTVLWVSENNAGLDWTL